MNELLEIIERGESLGLRGVELRTWFESERAALESLRAAREAERVMELEREREARQAQLERERQLRSARAAERAAERAHMKKELQELELRVASLEAKKTSRLMGRGVHVEGGIENAVETHCIL